MTSYKRRDAYRNFKRNQARSKNFSTPKAGVRFWGAIVTPAIVSFIVSGGVALLTNPAGVWKSWNDFPEERDRSASLSWRATDQNWSGIWSTAAEGYVNSATLHDQFIEMEFETNRGKVEGSISAYTLCDAFPVYREWLVDGRATEDRARLTLYDFKDGQRVELRKPEAEYSLTVVRNEDDPTVLRVVEEDMWGLLPLGAGIRLHPPDQLSPTGAREDFNSHCDTRRKLEWDKHLLDPGYRDHLAGRKPEGAPDL